MVISEVRVIGQMDNTLDHTFELANALTTVQKDNMVLEEKTELNEKMFDELEKVRRSQEEVKYRIRKLTPRECWRLMGYTDEDFDKAASVNSNSQLYKQAGNAIVKQVLMAIFSQLFIQNITAWNERKAV